MNHPFFFQYRLDIKGETDETRLLPLVEYTKLYAVEGHVGARTSVQWILNIMTFATLLQELNTRVLSLFFVELV
jgi:hypothetical protein